MPLLPQMEEYMKSKIRTFISNLDMVVMCFFLVVIFITLFAQVIMRWVFRSPLTWSEELARYSYVWITMLAFGYNQRTRNNIPMTLITDMFPSFIRLLLEIITDIMIIVACCLPLPSIFEYLRLNINMHSNTLGYSLGFVAVSIPIGFIYTIISVAVCCVLRIIHYRKVGAV